MDRDLGSLRNGGKKRLHQHWEELAQVAMGVFKEVNKDKKHIYATFFFFMATKCSVSLKWFCTVWGFFWRGKTSHAF